MPPLLDISDIQSRYVEVRAQTTRICAPLQLEDYVVQPIADVSPPKWHLGHTTWFFEMFILKPYVTSSQEFDPNFNFVFNSYYETVGKRVLRTNRGNLSRPTVHEVYRYRDYVDKGMQALLVDCHRGHELYELVELGLNHEQQHQELLYTDIKYILGHNPLFPVYKTAVSSNTQALKTGQEWLPIEGGLYQIGFHGDGFSWDNEHPRHKVFLNSFEISIELVTNREYLEFVNEGAYQDFRHWHSDGWSWMNSVKAQGPLYWHQVDRNWFAYTWNGLVPLELDEPVTHINYYEAWAFASWKEMRLPTKFEWEVAADRVNWEQRWEWTGSAYLPYPGYRKAPGALGEYNGKFMVNQQVLRGASEVTPKGHGRITYRNFFQPALQWQFTGIRLAR